MHHYTQTHQDGTVSEIHALTLHTVNYKKCVLIILVSLSSMCILRLSDVYWRTMSRSYRAFGHVYMYAEITRNCNRMSATIASDC